LRDLIASVADGGTKKGGKNLWLWDGNFKEQKNEISNFCLGP
jgi:hypothetical protein